MRHRGDGKLACFVRVAEQEFTGRKRRPGSVGQQLALSGLRTSLDAEIVGIAETIGKAEVFARCRLAVDDLGCRILRAEDGCAACCIQQRQKMRRSQASSASGGWPLMPSQAWTRSSRQRISQCSGEFTPVSPRIPARCLMPC